MNSKADIYEKAMAAAQEQQPQQGGTNRMTGAVPGLEEQYRPYPSEGDSPQDIIEYLTVQLGIALTERKKLRGRVWQLENVNETHLARYREAENAIRELRMRLAAAAPEKSFVVVGCSGKYARSERVMPQLSCQSGQGTTRIRIDLRKPRRDGVDKRS